MSGKGASITISRGGSPCQKCSDRTLGCHGKCERYSKFRKELDGFNETKDKNRSLDLEAYGRYHDRLNSGKLNHRKVNNNII